MSSLKILLVILQVMVLFFVNSCPGSVRQPKWVAPKDALWRIGALGRTQRFGAGTKPLNNSRIDLACARNEWVSFQIVINADKAVRDIFVIPGDLSGPGGIIAGGEAELYRQHKIKIKKATFKNEDFTPGLYNDPLIPLRHPVTGETLTGGTLQAMPFDVLAGQNEAMWIDIFVPSGTAPGTYRGIYTVQSGTYIIKQIEVELTVWDFVLPDTPSLATHFGSPADYMQSTYSKQQEKDRSLKKNVDWEKIRNQCNLIMGSNKLNASASPALIELREQPDGSFIMPRHQIDRLGDFIDTYNVSALQIPAYGEEYPRILAYISDPVAESKKMARWFACWDEVYKALDRDIILYTYLFDEPNTLEEYNAVRKWGKAVKALNTVVKVLVVEQITPDNSPHNGDLYGAVDIWCLHFSSVDADAQKIIERSQLGEQVWTYQALTIDQETPWWHIDFPLLNFRIPAWLAWRYQMTGLLYWGEGTYWDEVKDPWNDSRTWQTHFGMRVYNGEGALFYPAEPVGYEGIVPSIRVKAIRDSIEDYEYLAILEKMGLRAEADAIISPLLQNWSEWDKDPAKYEEARKKLAGLIVKNKKKQNKK